MPGTDAVFVKELQHRRPFCRRGGLLGLTQGFQHCGDAGKLGTLVLGAYRNQGVLGAGPRLVVIGGLAKAVGSEQVLRHDKGPAFMCSTLQGGLAATDRRRASVQAGGHALAVDGPGEGGVVRVEGVDVSMTASYAAAS